MSNNNNNINAHIMTAPKLFKDLYALLKSQFNMQVMVFCDMT